MTTITKITILATLVLCIGCKKDFLNAKPDDSLVVPQGLSDMQQILDNDKYMNGGLKVPGPDPNLGNESCDDYYVSDISYSGLDDFHKAVYIWAKSIPWPVAQINWKGPYRAVFYANTALDGLKSISPAPSEQTLYNNLWGSALFYRSYQFFNIAQIFAAPYDAAKAATDPGIPLRLSPDISELSARATLQETYDRILGDLKKSLTLLPNKSLMQTRPSRDAAYALLARVYLTMGDYNNALRYCDSSLMIDTTLLDYNKISATQSVPFTVMNQEVIFAATVGNGSLGSNSSAVRLDTTLIASYRPGDLRRNLFFKASADGRSVLKGSYSGTIIAFSGIARDEVYLMRAECYARQGNVNASMQNLNILLKNRYDINSFSPLTATDAAGALNKVLEERRKELVMRNLRWQDLRRLNKEGRNITLTRIVNGITYTLPPNDPRYTWPIPNDVIGFTDMQQNPR